MLKPDQNAPSGLGPSRKNGPVSAGKTCNADCTSGVIASEHEDADRRDAMPERARGTVEPSSDREERTERPPHRLVTGMRRRLRVGKGTGLGRERLDGQPALDRPEHDRDRGDERDEQHQRRARSSAAGPSAAGRRGPRAAATLGRGASRTDAPATTTFYRRGDAAVEGAIR